MVLANPSDPVSETQRQSDAFAFNLAHDGYESNQRMTRAYNVIVDDLERDLFRVTNMIEERKWSTNQDVPVSWVHQQGRYTDLLVQAEQKHAQYARVVGEETFQVSNLAVQQAERDGVRLLNASAPRYRGIGYRWNGLPEGALEQLQSRFHEGQPLAARMREYGNHARYAIDDGLTTGLAKGLPPARIVANIRERMNGAILPRATTLVTTEQFRAYREANRRVFEANRHIAPTWIWNAHVGASSYTCASCYAMHGQEFPVDTPMGTHPNCRCTMIPKTVDWADIVGDESLRGAYDEGRPRIFPGVDLFRRLPADRQRKMLGPRKFDLYQKGEIDLPDLVAVRRSPLWGTSRSIASIDTALQNAQLRKGRGRVPGFVDTGEPRGPQLPFRDADTPQWVRDVDSLIVAGIRNEEDVRKIGNLIRKNIPDLPANLDQLAKLYITSGKKLKRAQKKLDNFENTYGRVRRDDTRYTEYRKLQDDVYAAQRSLDDAYRGMTYRQIPADKRQRLEELKDEQNRLMGDMMRADRAIDVDTAPLDDVRAWERQRAAYMDRIRNVSDEIRAIEALETPIDLSQIVPDYIRKFRSVGKMGRNHEKIVPNSDATVQDVFEKGMDNFPTAWVDASRRDNPLFFEHVPRGYHSRADNMTVIATSGDNFDSMYQTMIHEIGHRMEHSVPMIKQLEREWYQRRVGNDRLITMNKAVGVRYYRRNEVTRPDDFFNPYIGKDYGGNAYEIVSMGVEAVLAPDAIRRGRNITADPDMLDFIIGLLAGV